MAILLFGILIVHSLSITRMYIPRKLETYKEGMIHPGHIVSTFPRIDSDFSLYLARQSLTLMNGYSYFHTGIIVNYNNQDYILHYNPGDLLEQRKLGSYNSFIRLVYTRRGWYLYLEPLLSFLEAQKQLDSFLSIVDTGKYLLYDEDTVNNIQVGNEIQHCCWFVGKYLEQLGLCQNKSLYPDFIYYTPEYYASHFGNFRELKL